MCSAEFPICWAEDKSCYHSIDSWYPGPDCQSTCSDGYKPAPPRERGFLSMFKLAADAPAAAAPTQRSSAGVFAVVGVLALMVALVAGRALRAGGSLPTGYSQV